MISSISIYSSLNFYEQEYDSFTDEELIKKIREEGDDNAERCLYKRYIFIIKRISSSFFLIGGSIDDLFQEAMIGLIKAVKNFDEEYETSFRTYSEVCIRRQIISAIRKTKPYEVLNMGTYLYDLTNESQDLAVLDEYSDLDSLNPENLFICKEEKTQYYIKATELLSNYERAVLTEYGKGKTYEEISRELNKSIKSVDNALQRVKKKIGNNKDKLMN